MPLFPSRSNKMSQDGEGRVEMKNSNIRSSSNISSSTDEVRSSESSDNNKDTTSKGEQDSSGSSTSLPYLKACYTKLSTPRNSFSSKNKDGSVASRNVPFRAYVESASTCDIKKGISTLDISSFDDIDMSDGSKVSKTRKNMTILYSCIYGMLVTIIGGVIYVNHQTEEARHICELFSTCISLVGLVWLLFFHTDLFRYKRKIMKQVIAISDRKEIDSISTSTDFNFGMGILGNEEPPYRFLTGRHSGSFYLKIGLAAFCFGHLINEGLLLGQQILDYVKNGRAICCVEASSLISHIVRPLYSFYQLFIVFKYSNIVINKNKTLASFALMHIMATCICFWFGTIVEDALEDYDHKLKLKEREHNKSNFHSTDRSAHNHSECVCRQSDILSINNIQAIPYLYPFTIEFNLLLAGVWFVVWNNIGKEGRRVNPHHFHHKIHKNDGGIEEVTFHSNLVLNADCHASNKGLFAGFFIMLASIISIIVFFVAMSSKNFEKVGLSIHYFQEGTLTTVSMIGVLVAYRQLAKLDFNKHPITFLDDVLLFVPLPFYFIQSLLTIISEYQKRSTIRIVMSALVPIQVVLQTPLIVDGLRRCSNTQELRYKKPGREVVTFLIICNLTMWIINTFEAKSVESHYGMNTYFGEFLWMFVSHTNLPLMLFYRFHSSVCLADIWKSAYEKGE